MHEQQTKRGALARPLSCAGLIITGGGDDGFPHPLTIQLIASELVSLASSMSGV